MLSPSVPAEAPADLVRDLYRLSDPALSELGLDQFLDELLNRVRDALGVDTAAILLLDREAAQLVARAAKGLEEEVEQGVRIPIGKGFAGRIAAERVAIFIADVDHADILNPILREKRIRSLLGVPLIVEGDLIGVMHVGSLTPRVFDAEDLALLEVAAARAAPGIERARLYTALEREHRVAVLLQRSLLPRGLPDVVGVPVAARYLSARDEVGGDWYDVIELPEGRLGIAIGDVVGHGLGAAALMGQLRTALRAYAQEGHGPSRTLELVDCFVQTMPQQPMATAAYAQFDPQSGKLALATAGHLPPAIVGPLGPRSLRVTPGAPLGAFPYGAAPEQELTLQSGEVIVMYTDGLIERRGEPLELAIDKLLELIREASSAEEACQLAFDGLVPPEGLDDDVAIVALQNAPVPNALRLALAADPKVLAHVRRAVRRWLSEYGTGAERSGEIALAVSEACANAIEHAYAPGPASFELQAEVIDRDAVFTVRDWGRWRPARRGNRGRGLRIIDAAMDDVRLETTPTGTTIVMRRRLGAG